MSLKTIINGIDVGRQRAPGGGSWPERAHLTTSTEWLGGTQTRTLVAAAPGRGAGREFTLDADYPDAFLGSGVAPSPDELLMAAVGASFVTSFVLAAAAAAVRIESLRVLTARAALAAPGDGTAAAPGDLELRGEVDADVSSADLARLVAIARESSLVVALSRSNIQVHLEQRASDTGVVTG